jgi:hypothetical protein
MKLDKELQEFYDQMKPPDTFEDGFSWVSLVGAIFIGLLMVPGSIYMGLVAGLHVGGASSWVTVILFLEIARRTHKRLKRAEIFVLFYMSAAAVAAPFGSLLYRQFFVQSNALVAQGWQDQIPGWYAPSDPAILGHRSFFMWEWLVPVGMVMLFQVINRLDSRILGYGLFKVTSDYEKLPFPMAPVGAQGIMALAEEDEESTWRWRSFAIGGAIGLGFGAIYMGVPILSNTLFNETFQPLPIPFVDWTGKTDALLPAVATGLSFDATHLLVGMVMPWWVMVGSFAGLIATYVLNPVLYNAGVLVQWRPGDGTIMTLFKNMVDFYFSFGIGLSLAIAVVGFYSIWASVRRAKAEVKVRQEVFGTPSQRGDIPNWLIIGVYLLSCSIYIGVCGVLIDWHPGVMIVVFIYAFLYTPLISYVTARLEGICGQVLNIPLAREVGFILSGYNGIDVWFLPIPMVDYGIETVFYRQAELTGTKFRSVWKADLILIPFILICSITFANFIWSMAAIPSPAYPFTEKIWEFNAMQQTLIYSSTAGERQFSQFRQALNGWYILSGGVIGVIGYGLLAALSLPVTLFFGFVRGINNQTVPHTVLTGFLGACLGRFYFQRKLGKSWRMYIPVVLAGFSCGMGLISMLCIGLTFLSKAVFTLSY